MNLFFVESNQWLWCCENCALPNDLWSSAIQIFTSVDLPLKVMRSADAGFCRQDPRVVPSQHTVVARATFHVDLLLTHNARLALKKITWRVVTANKTFNSVSLYFTFFYLVMKVPRLVVALRAPSCKHRLVVDFDKLPFGAMAEMAEKPTNGPEKDRSGMFFKCLYFNLFWPQTLTSWFGFLHLPPPELHPQRAAWLRNCDASTGDLHQSSSCRAMSNLSGGGWQKTRSQACIAKRTVGLK